MAATGRTAATARTAPTATALPDAIRRALTPLVGAANLESFLGQAFGKDAWRGQVTPDAARRLLGWPQLNAALAEHRLAPPRLRLERAGADATSGLFKPRRTRRGALLHDLDAAELNARLRDGATLILDAANELSPPLQAVCADLAAAFACSCQTNAYACWGTTQGFDVHWDDHDVFVVQVEGRKRWALYGATRGAPTRKDLHAEHARPDTPIEEIVLEPGDVLYLPRGYWHAAVGLGGPTLHLTIGLTRKTGTDFLHWLADQALAEEDFRRDLPLEWDDGRLGAHLSGLLAQLATHDPDELGRLYRRHVEAAQPQRAELAFPYIGEAAEFGPGAVVRLAPGAARLEPGRTPGEVVLTWRGVVFTVAAALEPALARLTAGEALTYEAFEEMLPEAARRLAPAFVAEMAQRGAFVVGPLIVGPAA